MNSSRASLPYIAVSLLIALVARFGPQIWFRPFTTNFDLAVQVSLCLAVLWLAMLGGGLYRHHWHGLWILVGAPLALYYPYRFAMLAWECSQNSNMCP
jgi:hypothetical protein